MVHILSCVVCLTKCKKVVEMRQHMTSPEHTQNMSEILQKEFFYFPGFFPYIEEWAMGYKFSKPVLGLSLLTLCFSSDVKEVFYLCHACEEKVPPEIIYSHMYSAEHQSNYYNFTDPNCLFFAWRPDGETRMSYSMKMETSACPRSLQLLDLPKAMWAQFQNRSYFEVMSCISRKVAGNIKALGLPRVEISDYSKNANKRHPLLGMQHIVECTTTEESKKCYLCTLCKLSFPNQLIIKHLLSFDHIFSYFASWHASSLMPKLFYTGNKGAWHMMLDLAKKSLDRYGCGEMRQLRLEPDVFETVNFFSYDHAFAKLESIAVELHEPSLVVNVIPEELGSIGECKILCQNCDVRCLNQNLFFKHVLSAHHQKMRNLLMGAEQKDVDFNASLSSLHCVLEVDKLIHESKTNHQAAVGSTLVMSCLSSQDRSNMRSICFACELVLWHTDLFRHLKSREHRISTLMYLNPWRLPFAFQGALNVPNNNIALEEELKRGPKLLRVLDLPRNKFSLFSTADYKRVMEELSAYDASFMDRVPPRNTFSSAERFPLLGVQFMVKYSVAFSAARAKFVCMLCQRKVESEPWCIHVFSREHVVAFLHSFHPGSVDSSTTEEELLDLAKQSMALHPTAEIQEVELSRPIRDVGKLNYRELMCILRANKGSLDDGLYPPVTRHSKLVPRTSGKAGNTNPIVASQTERTDQNFLDKLNIAVEGNTSVTAHKERESEPPSDVAISLEEKEEENKDTLMSEELVGPQIPDAINTSQRIVQKHGETMTNLSPGFQDAEMGSARLKRLSSGSEASPEESSKHKTPRVTPEVNFSEELRQNLGDDVRLDGASPVIAVDNGALLKSHGASGCGSQNSINVIGRNTAEDMDLQIQQEPVDWTCSPTPQYRSPQVLGSPAAACTLNLYPEFATGSTLMSSTNHRNMDGKSHVSPQIASPRTSRTTQRSLSTDHSRPACKSNGKDKRPPKIGLSYIITVICGDKQQVYCQLCFIRLNHSTHLSSEEHQRKYIKKRFPHWNAESPDEDELAKMVNKLVDMDRGLSDQKISVGFDVYQNLAVLPEAKAILILREMLGNRAKRHPSSVTLGPDDVSCPRKPPVKGGSQNTPGHLQRQSISPHNITEDSQKSVGQPATLKPLKATEKSPAGLSIAHQTLVKRPNEPYEAKSSCATDSLKDHQKPHEASEKSHAGFPIANHSFLEGRQNYEATIRSPSEFPSANPCSVRDHQNRYEAPKTSYGGHSSISHEERSSTSNQNFRVDGQTPTEATEKSLPGSSSVTLDPCVGFPRHDGMSLQGCPKPQDVSCSNGKVLKTPEMVSSGFSTNNITLMKPYQKPHDTSQNETVPKLGEAPGNFLELPQKSPPAFFYTHWKLPKVRQGASIPAESQKKSGQKPLKAPEISPAVHSNGDCTSKHMLEPGQTEQHMTKHGHEAIDVTSNDLLSFLKKNDVQPLIGLALIWECQLSPDSPCSSAVYLCVSCSATLVFEDLIEHLVSIEHLRNYLLKEYAHLMDFWFLENLLPWMKEDILLDVAHFLSVREQHFRKHPQVVCVSQVLYNKIKAESFSNALKIALHCKRASSL